MESTETKKGSKPLRISADKIRTIEVSETASLGRDEVAPGGDGVPPGSPTGAGGSSQTHS